MLRYRRMPLDNGSKKVTYVCLLFIACFILPICNGQNGINDYIAATWNTNGAKWEKSSNVLNIPMVLNSGVEVLAVQEGGKIPSFLKLVSTPSNIDIVKNDGTVLKDTKKGVDEYNFNTGKHSVFVYVYNRDACFEALNYPKVSKPWPVKQNLAVVSRHKANNVIIIERVFPKVLPSSKRADREYINKPALGIVIGNAAFFSLHPEPGVGNNESPVLISNIQTYMNNYHLTKSWIAMGDYNRSPENLNKKITTTNKLPKIISSGEITHIVKKNGVEQPQSNRELDYAVVGSAMGYFNLKGFPHATLLLPTIDNPSDHKPVLFQK